MKDLPKPSEVSSLPVDQPTVSDAWAMVEASPDGMIMLDQHGVILTANGQIESLFGYTRTELVGCKVEELIPERFRQIHTAHRTRYRARPKSRAMAEDLELMARRQDGQEFPVEVSLSPVTIGGELRVVATVRDITARRAVEAHGHAVLHTIDSAHDGVFMFTADTLQFGYVNQGAATQLGYDRHELLAMSPLHIKPEFTEASFRELIEPLLRDELDSLTFTTVHRRKDGRDVPVEIILEYPPAAGPGEPRMLVALVRDIADRLEAEQALRASEAAVRMLEDRERLAFDLHDLVIQRLFAAGMSLQAVQSVVDDPEVASRIKDTVGELDQAITELRSTIFNLTRSKGRSLTDLVSEVVTRASTALGFDPTVTVAGDLEAVRPVVAEQLLPVLTEALSNVAHHANAASAEVRIDVADGDVDLVVADDGVGLDPASVRGHGLNNLAARARRVNGKLTTKIGPSGGTVLTWTTLGRSDQGDDPGPGQRHVPPPG